MKQENLTYPMNQPYISNTPWNQRRVQNSIQGYSFISSYESQSTLKNQYENGQLILMKPYSFSSTNLNDNQFEQEKTAFFKKEVNLKMPSPFQNLSNKSEQRSQNSFKKSQKKRSSANQSQQISTQLLHEKIRYLERQLQELTKLLQEQSKQSGYSQNDGYQQLAIQNAQLTIKVQQLQEEKQKILNSERKIKQEYQFICQDYQNEHQLNNNMKQKIIDCQQKIIILEKNFSNNKNSQSQQLSNEESKNQPANAYSAALQRQNQRLNEQIENLLSKLHNLNLQINEEQTSKQQVISKMNQQLNEIEKLRKQISDMQVSNLQLQQLNNYLKKQIDQVNELGLNKQKQIQDRYIKQEIQARYAYESIQNQNQELQSTVIILQKQLRQAKQNSNSSRKKQQYAGKDSRISQHGLKSQIKLLNQELEEEKQRYQLIKIKYNEMLQNQQNRIQELQNQNRKLNVEARTLRVQSQDRRKQVEEKQWLYQQVQQKISQMSSNREYSSTSRTQIQRRVSEQNRRITEQSKKIIQENKIDLRYKDEQIQNQSKQLQQKLRQIFEKDEQIYQKQEQCKRYFSKIRNLQIQLNDCKQQLQSIHKVLQLKQQQINQKNQLTNQLYELQSRHQQLIQQVNIIKKSKNTQFQDFNIQREIEKQSLNQKIIELNNQVSLKSLIVRQLQQKYQSLANQLSKIQQNKQTFNKLPQFESVPCQVCPQILKQFNIYKELMELKFQTMNQMLDELKISFTRNQFQMREQINRDKTKYDFWMQQYDNHDKQYKTLMERLWQWEKINAKNQRISQSNSPKSISINISEPKNSKPHAHLSQIQYDLYLIKLENSTLRSQIANLQKQLSQRDKNPQIQRQLSQLKKYNDNLLYQNQELKNHLNQVVSQKKISSSKEISVNHGNPNELNRNQTIFQRYSNAIMHTSILEKNRSEQKALASAQLLISKLKKQNDNLIKAKKYLEEELESQNLRYRELISDLQTERQKTKRQQNKTFSRPQNYQILDRNNIPIQYIKRHPEHKKLQIEYVSMKRSFLELDLQFKKTKQFYEQELQKMKIENDFHIQKINELQISQKGSNVFSFNAKFFQQNTIQEKISLNQSENVKNLLYAENKIKTLEERIIYLEKQVEIKITECQSYGKKYQELIKLQNYHPKTPRNQYTNSDGTSRLPENISVSPIQSPQWQDTEGNHSERDYERQNIFDQKILQKLKNCINIKLVQLQITPRQSSNLIIKTIWFIQRITSDIRDLRNNIDILKRQKKSIIKQRNQLKQKLQDIQNGQEIKEQYLKSKIQNLQANQTGYSYNNGLNKIKIQAGHKSVPKLIFDQNGETQCEPQNQNQMNLSTFSNVINETQELKNQRRTGLKRFQKKIQKLGVS